MEPLEYLAAFAAAISLVEKMLPGINNLYLKGLITKEQQADVMAKYQNMKASADALFEGPEWMPSTT